MSNKFNASKILIHIPGDRLYQLFCFSYKREFCYMTTARETDLHLLSLARMYAQIYGHLFVCFSV